MSVAEAVENEDSKPKNTPKLRVITGGKGPTEPPSEDWLKDLSVGTTFVAQPIHSEVDANLYCVIWKNPPFALLAWKLPDQKVLDYHVNTAGFCKKHKKDYTILGSLPIGDDNEQEKEDEQRNRSD